VRTETIKIRRLTDFVSVKEIAEPALLKLDVQNFELEVLRGCKNLLGRFSQVYAECSFCERGFLLNGVYHMGYDRNGRAVQGDFLFKSTD